MAFKLNWKIFVGGGGGFIFASMSVFVSVHCLCELHTHTRWNASKKEKKSQRNLYYIHFLWILNGTNAAHRMPRTRLSERWNDTESTKKIGSILAGIFLFRWTRWTKEKWRATEKINRREEIAVITHWIFSSNCCCGFTKSVFGTWCARLLVCLRFIQWKLCVQLNIWFAYLHLYDTISKTFSA